MKQVQLPNGQIAEFPDDMGNEQIAAVLQKQFPPQTEQPVQLDPTYDPTEGMTGTQRLLAGIGSGMTDIGLAAQQLLGRDVGSQVDEKRQLDKPLMDTTGGAFGRGAAYALPVLAAPFTATGALASGAAMGALEPLGSTEDISDRAKNAASNAALNLAGFGLFKGIGKAAAPFGRNAEKLVKGVAGRASVSPEYKAAVDYLKKAGVPMNMAEQTGSPSLGNLMRVLANNPVTAGLVQADKQAQIEALNRLVGKQIGREGQGLTIPEVQSYLSQSGSALEDLTSSIPNVPLTKQFIDDLAKVESEHGRLLEPLQSKTYQTIKEDLLNRVIANDLTGAEAQATRSKLGQMAMGGDVAKSNALKGIQRAIDAATARAATPEAKAAIDAERAIYSNLRKIMPKKGLPVVSDLGDVIPSRLAAAGRREGGDFGDLARAVTVLRDAPSSGTAQQQFWQQLLSGTVANPAAGGLAGAVIGGASGGDLESAAKGALAGVAPKVAYRALNTPAGAAYIQGGLRNWLPQQAESALLRLLMTTPTAAVASNRPK